jgi:MerR family transcriptional regulator/heat shock protein HspR
MPERRKPRAVYVISVAAEMAGMHPQTLRIYERKGLIEPYRTPGGTRRYSQEDIVRLAIISELTESGLNLAGVKRVLALQLEMVRLGSEIEKMRNQIVEVEEAATRQVREVHRSYRREIVLRSQALPEVRRKKA